MAKASTFGPWMVAAVVIAAIATPLARRSGAPQDSGASTAGPTTTQGSAAARSAARESEDDYTDTIELIGQSLGVDVTEKGLERRASWSLRTLQSKNADSSSQKNAIEFLNSFLNLRIREFNERTGARAAIARLAKLNERGTLPSDDPSVKSAVGDIAVFLDRYFDRYALSDRNARKEDVLIAQDYDQLDKTLAQVKVLRQALDERKSRVEFLIVTVPDPIDSFTGWQFDPMLDAVAQAVSASDYVLDRFHFPDSDPEDSPMTTAEQGRIHEIEPGVVVFKRRSAEPDGYSDRLVVLTVHENPAAGIHVRALVSALWLVVRCTPLTGQSNGFEVRVLGPTFSGSSETLNRALQTVDTRLVGARSMPGDPNDQYNVRIISGSATDPANKSIIERGGLSNNTWARLHVKYQTTVHPDDILLPKISEEMKRAGWSRRIAVLFEANTQYGREIRESLLGARNPENPPPSFVGLPFPMNVSRLRTTVDQQDPTRSAVFGLPSRFRPVPMEVQGNPSDQIPQFNPKTTATYIELALAGMLDTMRREDVKTVALMATDPRDKLFLAQQIARYSPDVSIFTAESDSLYIHPDYSPYLRGALVGSTYPLYSDNQRWSYRYREAGERRQFANGSAQGVYNAALALLNYDINDYPLDRDHPVRLLEYGVPGESCNRCTPPVWVSVLGRSSVWPVRAYQIYQPADYLFAPRVAVPLEAPPLLASPFFDSLSLALAGVALAAWFTSRRTATFDLRRRAYVLILALGILFVQAFVWMICFLRVRISVNDSAARFFFGTASVALLAALYVPVRTVVAASIADLRMLRASRGWRRPAAWLVSAAVAATLWSAVEFVDYLGEYASGRQGDLAAYLSRTVDFTSGVSPLAPVLFLGLALVLLAIVELWRTRHGAPALCDPAVRPLLQSLVHGDVDRLAGPLLLADGSMLRVPRAGVAIAVLVLVVSGVLALDPFFKPLVSIEGPGYGRFVSLILLVVQTAIVLALAHFAFAWRQLRQLLDLMARHRLAGAYSRIPRELFPNNIFPPRPRLLDLQIPANYCASLGQGTIEQTFDTEMRTAPGTLWSASKTWKALVAAAVAAVAALPVARLSATAVPPGVAVVDVVSQQEELPVMLAALMVRDALSRLIANIGFVIGAAVLVFCSHAFFAFQQHTHLQAVGWTYIAIAFTIIMTALVQLHRNDTIVSLTSPIGGPRTAWDSALVLKVVVFGLLPLLLLFAAQFPEVGGVLLRWIEPVERALP